MKRTNQKSPLLEEMALFVRVVEAGSFSSVARQLGVAPSAVSRSMARLEKALGTQLLQRSTRKLALTQSGAQILRHCEDVVQAAQIVMDVSARHHTTPHGLVRISAPKAVAQRLIHPHMADFLAMYPDVDVHLKLDDRPLDLVEHQIDLAVRITEEPPVGLVGRRVMSIEHGVFASPAYLATHGWPERPSDLSQRSCIALGEVASDSRWQFVKAGQKVNVQVRGRYTANNTGVRLDAALSGLGIASLPWFTAQSAVQTGQLVQILPEWQFVTGYSGSLWLLYTPTRYMSAKLRVLFDYLAAKLG